MSDSHKGWFESRWALAPVGLLALSLSGLSVMVGMATHDDGFAVEPDYYKKAVNWDHERAQQAENQRLGYRIEVSVADGDPDRREVRATFTDARGLPVQGAALSLIGFHNARAMHVLERKLDETSPGIYTTTLRIERAGLWELRFQAQLGSEHFTQTARVDIRSGSRS